MKKTSVLALIVVFAGCLSALRAEVLIKSGETIAFLGDSITQQGNYRPAGYIHLVIDGLQRSGITVRAIPAGVGGHKSNQMLERLERDVLKHRPDWLLLSCGVNDVNHGRNGVILEDYKKNISSIVDQALGAGIKVMILTATMITENPDYVNNKKLAAYNDFLRELAAERKTLLADLNVLMQQEVAAKENKKENLLTVDGVHMNGLGNQMMASGILQAFGVPSGEIARFKEFWNDLPNAMPVQVGQIGRVSVSVNQYQALRKLALQNQLNLADLMQQNWDKMLSGMLTPAP